MLRKLVQSLLRVAKESTFKIKMSEPLASAGSPPEPANSNSAEENRTDACTDKRPHDECDQSGDDANKKLKIEKSDGNAGKPFRKKKMIMMLVYSGQGYSGMQKNPGMRTIESDLVEALLKAGVVNEEHAANPGPKMHFQRAARTDKGVSAAGQACSLNIFIDVANPVEKINSNLVDQIRIVGLQRVTKKFDSKNAADARTYMYMMPTFAFTPFEQFVMESFRITEEIQTKVKDTLALFKGTHNFHNFTSGKKSNDPSAKRYIMDFQMGAPFIRDGLEFVVITVKGQSFMLHQIRKMIGLTIAIVKGLTGPESVERAYKSEGKCDIPRAPGLGLVLDRVHYDSYNRKYGKDGLHEPILWEKYQDEIDEFKNKHIYPTIVNTEKEEKSMLKWLATLHLHHFEERSDSATSSCTETGVKMAHAKVLMAEKQKSKEADCSDVSAESSSPAADGDDARTGENENDDESSTAENRPDSSCPRTPNSAEKNVITSAENSSTEQLQNSEDTGEVQSETKATCQAT